MTGDELKLLVINARLDGTLYGGGRCPWCPYGTTWCSNESSGKVFHVGDRNKLTFIPCVHHLSHYKNKYKEIGDLKLTKEEK